MRRKEVIQQIKEVLKSFPVNTKTILYDSEARGEAEDLSDINLLIIVDKAKISILEEQAIIRPLYELELKSGIIISPKIVSKNDWENSPFTTPFQINVLNEGVLL